MRIRLYALTGAVAVLALLTGCSANEHQATTDSPHDSGDNTTAHIINFPDGFPGIASKCVGDGYRAWVSRHELSETVPVLRPDKSCSGYDGSQVGAAQGDEVPAPKPSPAS